MGKLALLIGVSEYQLGLNPLPSAVKDVEAMRRVLTHPEIGNFAQVDITVLKNPQRQEMEDAIYNLFAHRRKEDLLLFYFSGHGIKDDNGRLYLSTSTTRKQNDRLFKPSAVAATVLHENMNESRSQRQVIILDCCFSGAIAQGLTVKDDGTLNLQEQLGGKGRAILTSSTSTQYSFEQAGSDLSIYTRYLVEGMEKGAADRDGDGWISIDELHEYASDKVKEAAPAMTPKFYPIEEGHKILLAKSPVDEPRLKYRREVEVITREDEGEISPINRSYLNELRNSLNLQLEQAGSIEAEVLEPYRIRKEKLRRYEQVFSEIIEQQYPLTERDRRGLKRIQQTLNLRDEDIASIEKRIPRQRTRFSIRQVLTRQQFVRLAGFGSASLVISLLFRALQDNLFPSKPLPLPSPSPPQSPSSSSSPSQIVTTGKLSLQEFKFKVVEVGKSGNIITSRDGRANFFSETLDNNIALEMIEIPGGQFAMGSPPGENERESDEEPQHTVTIQPFCVGKFPVTQAQWKAVAALPKVKIDLNPDPSYFRGANRPVERVSWDDAIEFCDRLVNKTGKPYRLPSEAEWEYACRAETTTPFHFGETITTDLANYDGNYTYASGPKGEYRQQTTNVNSFPANAFGLYDMHGNVWEWCQDVYNASYNGAPNDGTAWLINNYARRVLRGGSCFDPPSRCRSGDRLWAIQQVGRDDGKTSVGIRGFRVVVARLRPTGTRVKQVENS